MRGASWNNNWDCGDEQGVEGEAGYGACTGTSMSAPHVTGLAALIRSVDPLIHHEKVRNILIESSHLYPNYDTSQEGGLGYGIPNALTAVEKTLGIVNGVVLQNRLTPLFSLYSTTAEDSFYTTVPQMAMVAIKGTLLSQTSDTIDAGFLPNYGSATPHFTAFPDEVDGFSPPLPRPTPTAEVYIFTTENNPIDSNQVLVPLYRTSYKGINNANNLNLDHFYTTEQGGITAAEDIGYVVDGIEGYIFSNEYSQPEGTVGLYRRYNPSRDDHAIFPEDQFNQMLAKGYTWVSGISGFISYAYPK